MAAHLLKAHPNISLQIFYQVADMDAAVRTIAGTARSMGIDVEGVN